MKRAARTPNSSSFRRLMCSDAVLKSGGPSNHVAIVGSGPSGFYTAKYLLDKDESLHIDMIEKLPVPYGLVRFGVAPDHPEVKSVQETFAEVAQNPRVRFFGNVQVKMDGDRNANSSKIVSMDDLRQEYKAVVLAYGAETDRSLNIKNEDSKGVLSARSFVNWYNGHPDYLWVGDQLDLSKVEHVAIVGQGNVAVDCARILSKTSAELAETDICAHALEKLKQSNVKKVSMYGRRGGVQAAFTIKELRELTKLDQAYVNITQEDMDASMNDATMEEVKKLRPKQRFLDLLKTIASDSSFSSSSSAAAADSEDVGDTSKKEIAIKFFRQPVAIDAEISPLPQVPIQQQAEQALEVTPIEGSSVHANRYKLKQDKTLRGIVLQQTQLSGPAGGQVAVPVEGAALITEECQLLLKSVGYKSRRVAGVPFDYKKFIVPNINGRVIDNAAEMEKEHLQKDGGLAQITNVLDNMLNEDEEEETIKTSEGEGEEEGVNVFMKGLYVVGWLKTGPTGTIATSVNNAKDTVSSMIADFTEQGRSAEASTTDPIDPIEKISALTGKHVVNWEKWSKIEEAEFLAGTKTTPLKPREKIVSKDELLKVAGIQIR